MLIQDRKSQSRFTLSVRRAFAVVLSAMIVQAVSVPSRAEDEAEARGPASLATAGKPVSFLTERQEKTIRNGLVNMVVSTSKIVRTRHDFEQYYLDGMLPSDKALFQKRLAEIPEGQFPKFRNENGDLVGTYSVGGQSLKIRIRWPDVREAVYFVNGVKFVYNPSKPLAPQLDLLSEQLVARKVVSAWDLFETEAVAEEDGAAILGSALDKVTKHPAPPPAAAAAATGATTAVSAAEAAAAATEKQGLRARISAKLTKVKVSNIFLAAATGALLPKIYDQGGSGIIDTSTGIVCWAVNKASNTAAMWACPEWRKAQLERLKKGNPNGALTKEAAVLARFEIDDTTTSCPDNDDGKPRVLQGRIRAIGFDQNNKKSFTGKWANIRFVWTPAGLPQSLIVTPPDMDPSQPITDPSAVHRIMMSLNFDKDGFLTGTTVPNETWMGTNSSILDSTTKTLAVDKTMTPEESAQYEKSKDVLFTSLTKAKVCIVATAQRAVNDNVSPVKAPPAGSGSVGAPQSVAPVPAVQ